MGSGCGGVVHNPDPMRALVWGQGFPVLGHCGTSFSVCLISKNAKRFGVLNAIWAID